MHIDIIVHDAWFELSMWHALHMGHGINMRTFFNVYIYPCMFCKNMDKLDPMWSI